MTRIGRILGSLVLVLGLFGTGCSIHVDPGVINPSDIVRRPMTIGTFGRVTTTDPAAATDNGSTVYALNVYQRLLAVQVGSEALKPDAVGDCMYLDPTTYTCGLKRGLSFTNGNKLSASDVKFSIERAKTLNVPGSSARLLDSITEMVLFEDDDLRIDFKLSHHDRAIGFALASPAASIVDEDTFPADEILPQGQLHASSGPFFADMVTLDEVHLVRYGGYTGATGTGVGELSLKTFSNPDVLSRAIATGTVDLLWRVPAELVPQDGSYVTHTLPGASIQRLIWNPESPQRDNAELRDWVRDATTPLRTLAAPIPHGVRFSADTFPVGGPKPETTVRGELTLGFDARLPGQAAMAEQVKSAIEPEVTVRLVGDDPDADIRLSASQAWTNTSMAWLQPYVEFPLPGKEQRVRELELAHREATGLPEAETAARAIQEEMVVDATVVPLAQSDAVFWTVPNLTFDYQHATWLGPCWQLAAWALRYT